MRLQWVVARDGAYEYAHFGRVLGFWGTLENATKYDSKADAIDAIARYRVANGKPVGIEPHGYAN